MLASLVGVRFARRRACWPPSADGKEIAGRLAARIGSGVLDDVVEVKEGGTAVHSIFGGAYTVDARGHRRRPR